MSNSIRAAALDAAIVEALRANPSATLMDVHQIADGAGLACDWLDGYQFHRELRHRLQRLQSAGAIKQARRGVWVLA